MCVYSLIQNEPPIKIVHYAHTHIDVHQSLLVTWQQVILASMLAHLLPQPYPSICARLQDKFHVEIKTIITQTNFIHTYMHTINTLLTEYTCKALVNRKKNLEIYLAIRVGFTGFDFFCWCSTYNYHCSNNIWFNNSICKLGNFPSAYVITCRLSGDTQ